MKDNGSDPRPKGPQKPDATGEAKPAEKPRFLGVSCKVDGKGGYLIVRADRGPDGKVTETTLMETDNINVAKVRLPLELVRGVHP